MKLQSTDLEDGAPIDARFAFGAFDPEQHMRLSNNLSPHLEWSGAPQATSSFAVLCVDPDVPSVADDVNREGVTIDPELPRVDFFHWVMVDIPAPVTALATGQCSDGVVTGGKRNPPGPSGSRQGLNNYTQFLAGSEMEGEYSGYDGPCPPWNDGRMHHYRFTVYALDVEHLDLPERFDGPAALEAMQGHVLAQASITGTYTLNPALR